MEEVYKILTARSFLYSLAQTVFGNEPNEQVKEVIDEDLLTEALQLTGETEARAIAKRFCLKADFSEELAALYVKLFIGPHKLAAPPWESVYRSNSRALFQRSTLDVRNAYREQGLLPALYPNVADDHVALELGFLALLAQRALERTDEGDIPGACAALEASRRFLEEHLLTWLDDYATDLMAAASDTLYSEAVCMATAFANRDIQLIRDIEESL